MIQRNVIIIMIILTNDEIHFFQIQRMRIDLNQIFTDTRNIFVIMLKIARTATAAGHILTMKSNTIQM
jgi:hypothetical protein